MKFDVYCDEARPDLFSSKAPPADYLVIGSLWSHREDRQALKEAIHALRNQHKVGGEFNNPPKKKNRGFARLAPRKPF